MIFVHFVDSPAAVALDLMCDYYKPPSLSLPAETSMNDATEALLVGTMPDVQGQTHYRLIKSGSP